MEQDPKNHPASLMLQGFELVPHLWNKAELLEQANLLTPVNMFTCIIIDIIISYGNYH